MYRQISRRALVAVPITSSHFSTVMTASDRLTDGVIDCVSHTIPLSSGHDGGVVIMSVSMFLLLSTLSSLTSQLTTFAVSCRKSRLPTALLA
jgi:hypothetical protein